MLYRVVRSCREMSALVVLGAYILAGGAAFMLMFIFPPGSLLILFVALLSLGFVVVGMKSLGWLEHRLARKALSRGQCPTCDRSDTLLHEEADGWMCTACGSVFDPRCARIEHAPHPSP